MASDEEIWIKHASEVVSWGNVFAGIVVGFEVAGRMAVDGAGLLADGLNPLLSCRPPDLSEIVEGTAFVAGSVGATFFVPPFTGVMTLGHRLRRN